jgi:hypothetical protein
MRPASRAALTLVLLLPTVPVVGISSLEGQIRLVPAVGLYTPLSDLGEVRDEAGVSLIEAGRRSSTLAYGGAMEWGGSRQIVALRLELLYGTSSDVPLRSVGCGDCELRSHLLAGTLGFVVRPFGALGPLHPYVLAGAGGKRYGFDWAELQDEGFRDYFRGQTRPAAQLGAGAHLRLGALEPRLELKALVSRFEAAASSSHAVGSDDRQLGLFLTFSLPLGGG